MEKEVRSIISRLKKGEMDVGDIPEETKRIQTLLLPKENLNYGEYSDICEK